MEDRRMKKSVVFISLLLAVFLCRVHGQEGSGQWTAPLDRFLEAFPVDIFVAGIASEAAQILPAEKRDSFTADFMKEVDIDEIEQILKKEFRRKYTDEELEALAELCTKPAGVSALKKYFKSMETIMAGIQGEIMRTRKKILSAGEKK